MAARQGELPEKEREGRAAHAREMNTRRLNAIVEMRHPRQQIDSLAMSFTA